MAEHKTKDAFVADDSSSVKLSATFAATVRDRLSAWETALARRDRAEETAAARLDDILGRLRDYSVELHDTRRDLGDRLNCVRDSLAPADEGKAKTDGGDDEGDADGAGGGEDEQREGK
jgi:hypothetical protein